MKIYTPIVHTLSSYRAVNTLCLSYKTRQLVLYKEIIAVCSQIHTKHINTLCGQNAGLLNVKLVAYSDHWAVEGSTAACRTGSIDLWHTNCHNHVQLTLGTPEKVSLIPTKAAQTVWTFQKRENCLSAPSNLTPLVQLVAWQWLSYSGCYEQAAAAATTTNSQ